MMINKKSGLFIVFSVLIGSVLFTKSISADASPYIPDWSSLPTASSLVVGVPYEDSGDSLDSGVIQLIYGEEGSGLATDTNEYFGQTFTTGSTENYDQFGKSVAVGDFNRDGFYDIAVGVPWESSSTYSYVGAVNILYGAETGFTIRDFFSFETIDIDGGSDNDNFGAAMTTGDFNGDGFVDLAVGAPLYDVNESGMITKTNAGCVVVFWGGKNGLSEYRISTIYGDDTDGEYGHALASADFDGDGYDDLVIGAPNHTTPAADSGFNRGGVVNIRYGADDITVSRQTEWNQTFSNSDTSEEGDHFGWAVAPGDFNGDGHPDLAIGVPQEDLDGGGYALVDVGAVNVLYNDGSDLSSNGAQVWFQSDVSDISGGDSSEPYDQFGYALVASDFDANGSDDLIIGVPFEDLDVIVDGNPVTFTDTGMYEMLRSTKADGLTVSLSPWFDEGYDYDNHQHYGWSMTVGDFDRDGKPDLVVGSPGYSGPNTYEDGAVTISYKFEFSRNERISYLIWRITQDMLSGVSAEDDDQFGWALATLPVPLTERIYLPLVVN
jgi:hypothetical protein